MAIEVVIAFVSAFSAFERRFGRTFGAFNVIGGLVQEFPMGNFDLSFFDADDHDFHLIADFDDVCGVIDIFPIQSGDVA